MKIHSITVGPVQTNVYLVGDEKTKEAVIIDPADSPEDIMKMIAESGFTVTKILLTHGHFDHIAALGEIAEKTGAEIYISEKDVELLRDENKNASMLFFGIDIHFDMPVKTVKNGDTITVGKLEFTVQETPGHTKGSVCYFAEKAIFTGDTIFATGYGRTDLYGGEYAALRVSLMELAPKLKGKHIYPGHGDAARF
ncbi:MAG: MBL fold metallo-hydrolase [Clostridia bacterium]|nr:MBL fold metallo-hydrolase [Clostridia bacterium]